MKQQAADGLSRIPKARADYTKIRRRNPGYGGSRNKKLQPMKFCSVKSDTEEKATYEEDR